MVGHQKRREEDLKKLKVLAADFPGAIEIGDVIGNPISVIKLKLYLRTAGSREFPNRIQECTDVEIVLPDSYPFIAPQIKIITPIWSPNIYVSGLVCHGKNWIISEGLDLLVIWLMKLLAYDPEIVNTVSPANAAAAQWYKSLKSSNAGLFPTVKLENIKRKTVSPRIQWQNISGEDLKTQLTCPSCATLLTVRVAGKRVRVTCTNCNELFEAQT